MEGIRTRNFQGAMASSAIWLPLEANRTGSLRVSRWLVPFGWVTRTNRNAMDPDIFPWFFTFAILPASLTGSQHFSRRRLIIPDLRRVMSTLMVANIANTLPSSKLPCSSWELWAIVCLATCVFCEMPLKLLPRLVSEPDLDPSLTGLQKFHPGKPWLQTTLTKSPVGVEFSFAFGVMHTLSCSPCLLMLDLWSWGSTV